MGAFVVDNPKRDLHHLGKRFALTGVLARDTRHGPSSNGVLTARPMHDTYGVIETPDNPGLVDPIDAASVGKTLSERAQPSMP
jgi:hypothetical protein